MTTGADRKPAAIRVCQPERVRRLPGGFLYHVREGRMLPPFIAPEAIDALRAGWDATAADTFICSAQKVGTHLTKKFVVELLAEAGAFPEGHPCFGRDIGHGAVPWPEVCRTQDGAEGWEAHLRTVGEGPRLWYTHCEIDDLPLRSVHPGARFLLVYRDPKAVAVSQYHFYRRHPLLEVDATLPIADFVDLFLNGALYFGDYHAHVRGWVERSSPPIAPSALLVLRYEDLVESPEAQARRIAAFLLPGRALADEALAQVVARTRFESMREELTTNPQTFHFRPEVFFRAGTTSDWQNHLTPALAARIDARTRVAWAGTSL